MKDAPFLNTDGPVQKAFERQDWAWLAGWLRGRFGVTVSADWCWHNQPSENPHYSDGSWAMFWKVQLIKAGHFEHEARGVETGRLAVPMHCFFLSLEETDEMLARLARPDASDDGARKLDAAAPGIERTNNLPQPIDATAAKVVGLNGGK